MRTLLLTSVLLLFCAPTRADTPAGKVLSETRNHLAFPAPDQLVVGDYRFSMGALSLWGATSSLIGMSLMIRSRPTSVQNWSSPQTKSMFFGGLQHLSWGAIDLGLGIGALAVSYSMLGRLRPPTNTQVARIFWINAGLDLLYLSFAAVAMGLSTRATQDRDFWRGTGESVAIQAGFLMVYDVANAIRFMTHARRAKKK